MTTVDTTMHAGPAAVVNQRERAALAHDLRGALHGVMGGVAMLRRVDLTAEVREQVDRIGAAADTLSCLAMTLVGEEMHPERREAYGRIDVQRFLRHLSRRWSGEAIERGVGFRLCAEPDLPGVLRADLVSLARALGNLLGNAVRYAWSGDVRLVVRRTTGGGIAFDVIDDGPGIPSDVVDRVLDASGRSGPVEGQAHGLGLHIARNLCVELGGKFRLRNRPGGGAEATLSFPAALCERDALAQAEPAPAGPDLDGLRILLAEDNPTNQLIATQMLRAMNADVTLSSDGVEALERFDASEFDLVVVDIEMPRMTGLDVIRTIRARRDGRADVPIVALTAYALREHRERIAAAGANGLISKPITSVEALGEALLAHAPHTRRRVRMSDAAAAVPAEEEPVADLAVFDALCAAIGSGMMSELLDKVVIDLLQARGDLVKGLSPLDGKSIRSASHILISVAGAIGAVRLQHCARDLNVAAHAEDARGLPDDVRRCLDEIDAAVAFAKSKRTAA